MSFKSIKNANTQLSLGGIKIKACIKKRILKFSCDVIALVTILVGVTCLWIRLQTLSIIKSEILDVLAARLVFSRGNLDLSQILWSKDLKMKCLETNEYKNTVKNDTKFESTSSTPGLDNFVLPDFKAPPEETHPNDEKTYKIIETHISTGGTKCENFYVKNSTGQEINFDEYLAKNPEINIKKTSEPQVLILHTHTSESYMTNDKDFFYESFYPRSLNDSENITQVGKIITETLIKNGIHAIHSTVYHDNPSYNGSYSRAAQTIKQNLEQYPSIQVVIDIHRDSLGLKESGKIKPIFTYQNKKASQLMIICGCDPDETLGFPNWRKNLSLALRLQKYCESMFPGITRPLNFAKVKYNEHLTPGSLLIEIGSEVNTLQESVYTGAMLGEAISKLLKDLIK